MGKEVNGMHSWGAKDMGTVTGTRLKQQMFPEAILCSLSICLLALYYQNKQHFTTICWVLILSQAEPLLS